MPGDAVVGFAATHSARTVSISGAAPPGGAQSARRPPTSPTKGNIHPNHYRHAPARQPLPPSSAGAASPRSQAARGGGIMGPLLGLDLRTIPVYSIPRDTSPAASAMRVASAKPSLAPAASSLPSIRPPTAATSTCKAVPTNARSSASLDAEEVSWDTPRPAAQQQQPQGTVGTSSPAPPPFPKPFGDTGSSDDRRGSAASDGSATDAVPASARAKRGGSGRPPRHGSGASVIGGELPAAMEAYVARELALLGPGDEGAALGVHREAMRMLGAAFPSYAAVIERAMACYDAAVSRRGPLVPPLPSDFGGASTSLAGGTNTSLSNASACAVRGPTSSTAADEKPSPIPITAERSLSLVSVAITSPMGHSSSTASPPNYFAMTVASASAPDMHAPCRAEADELRAQIDALTAQLAAPQPDLVAQQRRGTATLVSTKMRHAVAKSKLDGVVEAYQKKVAALEESQREDLERMLTLIRTAKASECRVRVVEAEVRQHKAALEKMHGLQRALRSTEKDLRELQQTYSQTVPLASYKATIKEMRRAADEKVEEALMTRRLCARRAAEVELLITKCGDLERKLYVAYNSGHSAAGGQGSYNTNNTIKGTAMGQPSGSSSASAFGAADAAQPSFATPAALSLAAASAAASEAIGAYRVGEPCAHCGGLSFPRGPTSRPATPRPDWASVLADVPSVRDAALPFPSPPGPSDASEALTEGYASSTALVVGLLVERVAELEALLARHEALQPMGDATTMAVFPASSPLSPAPHHTGTAAPSVALGQSGMGQSLLGRSVSNVNALRAAAAAAPPPRQSLVLAFGQSPTVPPFLRAWGVVTRTHFSLTTTRQLIVRLFDGLLRTAVEWRDPRTRIAYELQPFMPDLARSLPALMGAGAHSAISALLSGPSKRAGGGGGGGASLAVSPARHGGTSFSSPSSAATVDPVAFAYSLMMAAQEGAAHCPLCAWFVRCLEGSMPPHIIYGAVDAFRAARDEVLAMGRAHVRRTALMEAVGGVFSHKTLGELEQLRAALGDEGSVDIGAILSIAHPFACTVIMQEVDSGMRLHFKIVEGYVAAAIPSAQYVRPRRSDAAPSPTAGGHRSSGSSGDDSDDGDGGSPRRAGHAPPMRSRTGLHISTRHRRSSVLAASVGVGAAAGGGANASLSPHYTSNAALEGLVLAPSAIRAVLTALEPAIAEEDLLVACRHERGQPGDAVPLRVAVDNLVGLGLRRTTRAARDEEVPPQQQQSDPLIGIAGAAASRSRRQSFATSVASQQQQQHQGLAAAPMAQPSPRAASRSASASAIVLHSGAATPTTPSLPPATVEERAELSAAMARAAAGGGVLTSPRTSLGAAGIGAYSSRPISSGAPSHVRTTSAASLLSSPQLHVAGRR